MTVCRPLAGGVEHRAEPGVLAAGTAVGAFAVIHGGTELGEGARVEDRIPKGSWELSYGLLGPRAAGT